MSIQSGLTIMDAYRNFVKEKQTKKEMDLVVTGNFLAARKPMPVPEPKAEHGKKGFFRR